MCTVSFIFINVLSDIKLLLVAFSLTYKCHYKAATAIITVVVVDTLNNLKKR